MRLKRCPFHGPRFVFNAMARKLNQGLLGKRVTTVEDLVKSDGFKIAFSASLHKLSLVPFARVKGRRYQRNAKAVAGKVEKRQIGPWKSRSLKGSKLGIDFGGGNRGVV